MRISDWSSDVCSSDLLNLPDVRGINVLAEIVGSRDMTVIILTGETPVTEIHSALKLGARAIVSKPDSLDHIVAACHAALAGAIYLSTHIGDPRGQFRSDELRLG